MLLPIKHVGDRRAHAAAQSRVDVEQLFTFIRTVRDEVTVGDDLKHEIAGSRNGSAPRASAPVIAPPFFLRDRIPRHKRAALPFRRGGADRGW